MTQSILIANAMTIFHVTDLNTYLLNKKNEFIFQYELVSIPAFFQEAHEKDLIQFSKQMIPEDKKVYSYVNPIGLHYLGFSFTKDENYSIIIGPYLTATPNYHYLTRNFQLNYHEGETLKAYCENLQVLPIDKGEAFVNILHQFDHMLESKPERSVITNVNNEESSLRETHYQAETDVERDIIELRYKVEHKIMNAVKTGNKQEAKDTFIANSALFTFSERFPNQPIIRLKNIATVVNALLRTAAKDGNVPSFLIHRISEKYAYKILYTNRINELQKMFTDMIERYSDLVLHHSLEECSTSTKLVLEYLVRNYDKSINKDYLSQITFTHPSHLSRKFKKETGKTVIGYQQMLRMNRAQYLLESENLPIEEISWFVGYEDSSYFSRVFKKEMGYTPTEYREHTTKKEQ